MAVTWGDLNNLGLTWGEIDKLGLTWGDFDKLTYRQLAKLIAEIRKQSNKAKKEGLKDNIAIFITSIGVLVSIIQLILNIVGEEPQAQEHFTYYQRQVNNIEIYIEENNDITVEQVETLEGIELLLEELLLTLEPDFQADPDAGASLDGSSNQ